MDYLGKLKIHEFVLLSSVSAPLFKSIHGAFVILLSFAVFITSKGRVLLIRDVFTDITKGVRVSSVPKVGFVDTRNNEVKAVRLSRETRLNRQTLFLTLFMDILPIPLNLWFMSENFRQEEAFAR